MEVLQFKYLLMVVFVYKVMSSRFPSGTSNYYSTLDLTESF